MSDVKKLWQDRDRVVRAITKDGFFRATAIKSTTLVRMAQEMHGLEPLRAIVLGRALTGAALLASFLKGEERVVVQLDGDGPISSVYAEALQIGEVRGYATLNASPDPEATSPLGSGIVKVSKVLYEKFEPVTGIVEMRRGDVTTDLSHYLTQSEQIPSAFIIDVAFDEHDAVRQAAGLLVQAMPGARPEDIFKVYDLVDYLGSLSEFIDGGFTPEEILRQVLPGEIDITAHTPVDFFCRCSIDRFKGMLMTLGLEEVNGMQEAGQNELVCQYCSKRYHLSDADFEELRSKLLITRN